MTIGILDSGVGGLSVLREIHTLLPTHSLLYIGDSAWCPYGNKSPADIQQRVISLTDHLIQLGATLIVAACNSATIVAIEALRSTYPVPIVGMEPAVKPAALLTKTGIIGILATEASLSGDKFHHLVDEHAHPKGVRVITRSCPDFVTLVERGELTGDHAREVVEANTAPFLKAGADTLVLGCTHYPFLRPLIQEVVGPAITLLDTGAAVARQVASLLPSSSNFSLNKIPAPSIQLLTTANLRHLTELTPKLIPHLSHTSSQLIV